MEISNPRRILAVSLEGSESHLSRLLKDLTGSSPESSSASLAGITHDLELKTSYYTASIPIWLDIIASPSEWASSFLSEEAREVLAVLGGLVLVFAIPNEKPAVLTQDDQPPSLIRHVGSVVQKGLGGWEWDGVRLAIGIGEGDADEWDELCVEAGLEFIQLKSGQMEKNEYGEKTGIPRVREALESNDWEQLDGGDALSDFDEAHSDQAEGAEDFDPESLDFGVDRSDFEGLRMAIWETSHRETGDPETADMAKDTLGQPKALDMVGGSAAADNKDEDGELGDEDIAKVEKMMRKLQAAKEMGEGMSEAQRKRLAARAVEEVMREL
ncbi:alpha and gamma adaptin binding protein p34 domain-containing protein [Trichoderma sp. SZMC 28014]